MTSLEQPDAAIQPKPVDIGMRSVLGTLLDGLSNLGFVHEDMPVNGADLVDLLNQIKAPLRAAYNIASRCGPEGRDAHLFCAVSMAFTALVQVGMYERGSVNGGDATDRFGELYQQLVIEPVPLGLRPQALYSKASGRFFTGPDSEAGWGEISEALLAHTPASERGHEWLAAARATAPDAAWVDVLSLMECDAQRPACGSSPRG